MPAFQALSAAVTEMEFAPGIRVTSQPNPGAPGATGAPLQVTPATPERGSVTVPVAVTVGVNKIEPSAGEEKATTGGALSRLINIVVVAVSPARLTAVP